MNCPTCGTPNPAQARFCLNCGRGMLEGVVCTSCHTLLPHYARFCFHCGTMVARALGTSAEPQVMVGYAAPAQLPTPGVQLPPPTFQTQTQMPAPAISQGTTVMIQVPPTPPKMQTAILNQLSEARPLDTMLPSLKRYLPDFLYSPLERLPSEKQLTQVREHLTALLRSTKTYLPQPVYMSPQEPGQATGNMFSGAFLFGDVSGFTPLSEKLKYLGRAGTEKIANIINDLFYDLVTILVDHGGILMKFGGDAVLGLFPATNDEEMRQAVLHASQAAVAMQATMSKFSEIEAGGETRALKIKHGISAGDYFAAHIGTKTHMAYVTTGHTVNQAEQAEGHADPGDIIFAPYAYSFVKDLVQVEAVEEEHWKLVAVEPMTTTAKIEDRPEPPEGELMAQITYLVNRMDVLSTYLPDDLISRMAMNPREVKIIPEHRPVTVMFANYVGISELIEDMGYTNPQLITDHLNNYFVQMVNIVERYDGIVARMDQYAVGDRLVIFFGALYANEDDPIRACYTALEMQKAVREKFAAFQTNKGIYRFRQRIGINSGLLFAGNVGATNLRQEYTLMGDDINMAARLMSKAGWQETFISKTTQETAAPFFNLKDRGELKVKGKDILIPTFELVSPRDEIGRTRGLEGGDSPYTGREDIFRQIQVAGSGFIKNQRGGIITVIGDSGLGKSRLIREFKTWIYAQEGTEDIQWLEARALSFSEQVAYWMTIHVLHQLLHLKADARPEDIIYALWELGEDLLGKETAREAIPFLANLMSLELEGEWGAWVKGLNPEVRQKQTFWAAHELFNAVAEKQRTIILLDDLHWGDEMTIALVENLLDVTVNKQLLFILVSRPAREKTFWGLRDKASSRYPHRYTEIQLKPLSEEYSRALLAKLLPGAIFEETTIREIMGKAAGNPFYLEEVVRTLIQANAVKKRDDEQWMVVADASKISVPSTLGAAITSRIDRLTEEARHALQVGAIIGRSFQMSIFAQVVKAERDLGLLLAQLERSELVHPLDPMSRTAFSFPNTLIQEVAYDNMLVQRRQEFHRLVGEALEELLGERVDDPNDDLAIDLDGDGTMEPGNELLAYHFSNSNDREHAIRYLERAGRKAQANFANETAIQHYTDLLTIFGDNPAHRAEAFEILEQRQAVYKLRGRQTERKTDLDKMLSIASTEVEQAITLIQLADFYLATGKYTEAETTARQALELEEKLGNMWGQGMAYYQLGVLRYYQGDYPQSMTLLLQAIELQDEDEAPEDEAWSIMFLGMNHFMLGAYTNAKQCHAQANELARKRQDHFQEGIHLTNSARVLMRLGRYDEALAAFKESLEMKTRVGDKFGQGFNLWGMGGLYSAQGNFTDAHTCFENSIQLRQQISDERGLGYCYYGMGMMHLDQQQYALAKEYLQQAYDKFSQLGLKGEVIEVMSYLGLAYLGLHDTEQALAISQQALDRFEEQKKIPGEEHVLFFNHFRILAGIQDGRAAEYVQLAYNLMMEQAELITDEEDRDSYMQNVKLNQDILSEAQSGTWGVSV